MKEENYIICKQCGERKYIGSYNEYAYKCDGYIFCSYSCMQKYKREAGKTKTSDEILKRNKEYEVHLKNIDALRKAKAKAIVEKELKEINKIINERGR